MVDQWQLLSQCILAGSGQGTYVGLQTEGRGWTPGVGAREATGDAMVSSMNAGNPGTSRVCIRHRWRRIVDQCSDRTNTFVDKDFYRHWIFIEVIWGTMIPRKKKINVTLMSVWTSRWPEVRDDSQYLGGTVAYFTPLTRSRNTSCCSQKTQKASRIFPKQLEEEESSFKN